MRRGMGITDIMLYIFVLFLVIIAMGITVFASASDGLITDIEIKSDAAQELLAESIAVRSVTESFSVTPISATEPAFVAFEIRQHEFIGFASTYVHTDEAREDDDVLESPWFDPVLRKGPVSVRLYRQERTDPEAPMIRSPYPVDFGFAAQGSPAFSVDPIPGVAAADQVWVWVPGYVGSTPATTAAMAYLSVPFEVLLDES